MGNTLEETKENGSEDFNRTKEEKVTYNVTKHTNSDKLSSVMFENLIAKGEIDVSVIGESQSYIFMKALASCQNKFGEYEANIINTVKYRSAKVDSKNEDGTMGKKRLTFIVNELKLVKEDKDSLKVVKSDEVHKINR